MWVPAVDPGFSEEQPVPLTTVPSFQPRIFTVEVRLASEPEECLWLLGAFCFMHEGLLSFINSGRRHEATAAETEDFTTPSIA